MKSITLGLAMGLLGGVALGSVALAQTPPAPKPPAPAAQPTPPAPPPPPPPQAQQQNAGNSGQPAVPTPGGPPEGMVVETPNGFFLVRPGDPNPRRLDLGQGDAAMGRNGPSGPNPRMGQDGQGDEGMDEAADAGMQPPPPRMGRGPMPPRPPEGKGARFRIRTPNLTIGMKCPDDEPIKACVDAVSQLLDKANTPPR